MATDKARLNWLSKRDINAFGNSLWVAYMPEDLEDGQTLREGIDAAMRAEKKTANPQKDAQTE